jgi:type I restriction-modification system DNA methylase subunit
MRRCNAWPSNRRTVPTPSDGANLGFEAKLWAAAAALRNNMDAAEYKHICGQESNYTTWRLAMMNLAICGIDAQIGHGDTFHNDPHPSRPTPCWQFQER